MTTLSVPDMSCGHCKTAIEAAIRAVDPGAEVSVDLDSRTVALTASDLAPVLKALEEEGYPATVAA
ncbi:heavy-metal-associated domain-containing protein [Frigidibacter sp. ROC022]|uniref:heavy-metal-associated domain-containing protein n=1 Tax=Frigidibacter sp. ROC022 TaxID=2971796 RepID=UPI00215A1FD1|nr:heavy-metal-associated domain-containing protein [Frigidibacter sp. ROC022]MCR8723437.1 heavy-metal-associated domain-containing protein [Frigidibacter sp. ROC022]